VSPAALSREALARNTAATSLTALGFEGLERVAAESSVDFAPDGAAVDPRLEMTVVHSEARALRPGHDAPGCVVCANRTCPCVDVHSLPGGDLAYLTPNLYPITYPRPAGDGLARGVHLVHWSSLRHGRGWPGADPATAAALLAHLARAEAFLLHEAGEAYPPSGDGHRGYVGVIKNHGERVGGSVEHDHQQILLSAAAPVEPRVARALSGYAWDAVDEALVVDEVGGRALTLVAPFMRRPLHAFVVPAGGPHGALHHLDEPVRDALAFALARLLAAVPVAMRARGDVPAYNLLCHAGPGVGPLFELRAYTQPLGGYEQLGLYLCEERPATSARRLRDALAETAG